LIGTSFLAVQVYWEGNFVSREFAHKILCLFEANFSGNSEGFPDGGGEGVFSTMGGGPSGVFEHHPDTAVPPSRIPDLKIFRGAAWSCIMRQEAFMMNSRR
jgi:hypothetical protein